MTGAFFFRNLFSLCVVASELFFQYAVDEFCFLFFSHLQTVFGHFLVCSLILSFRFFINTQIDGIQVQGSASFQYGNSISCH